MDSNATAPLVVQHLFGGPSGLALLETLRCPLSKESLVLTDGELVSPLGLAFRVSEDGIPNLIPADARMIADPQIEP